MRLGQIDEGDVLTSYFDTGAMGAKLYYVLVLRVNLRTVTVKDEHGNVRRSDPAAFVRKLGPTDWRPASVGGPKPCPCCAESEPDIIDKDSGPHPYSVVCGQCGLRTGGFSLARLALAAWNRRPS